MQSEKYHKIVLSFIMMAFIMFELSSSQANAFVMHDQSWYQIMIRYGFDFDKEITGHRVAFEAGYCPGDSNIIYGGTMELGYDKNSYCLPGLTFNIGYAFDPMLGDQLAVPVYIRMGMVNLDIGIVLAGGVQALVPGHDGPNLSMDALATCRIVMDKESSCIGLNPGYTPGMDFGLGFAAGNSGGSNGMTTTTRTYYY